MALGERCGDSSESKYCGVETDFDDDISRILESNMSSAGFDFVVSPLTDPTYRPCQIMYDKNGASVPPFVGSDLTMSPSRWSSHVVGKISSWIDLDSEDDILRADSEFILKQEIAWASHLSLQACLLPTPKSSSCSNYAKCVNQILPNLNNMQLWLRIPLEKCEDDTDDVDSVDLSGKGDFWEQWNMFRLLCEQHSQLSIALVISATLPYPNSIGRWFGEPVRAALINTECFLTNARGYPCLSKRHQNLIMGFFDHSVQVVISGKDVHNVSVGNSAPVSNTDDNLGEHAIEAKEVGFGDGEGKVETLDDRGSNEEDRKTHTEALKISDPSTKRHPLRVYLDYIAYLYRKMDPLPEKEQFEFGYRDFLQAPLQPLMDNLEAQTYETFEKDSVKYTQYQKAISQVLLERVPDEKASSVITVLMVMGAGRGPLVRASLQAAEETGRKLKIYAIEKNPNAVVTLHSLVKLEGWGDIVTIVSCDMRFWKAPEDADILVSELLGSFGDNELSPECLDGAEIFLKKDGVSIPSSYTSFLQPLTASKLHRDIMSRKEASAFETAYVVKMHNVATLAPPQPVFTFNHPDRSPNKSYQRYKKLIFELPKDTGSTLVHGFAGYFDATLYKDVHLGIEPSMPTPNMFSWFPIFFPLRTPIYLPPSSPLRLDFWRCCGSTKVWYEWCVSSPSHSPIHNSNGRSYWVGL